MYINHCKFTAFNVNNYKVKVDDQLDNVPHKEYLAVIALIVM